MPKTSPSEPHAPPAGGAWVMPAWPPLLWQPGIPERARFRHLDTRVRGKPGVPWPAGRTLWAASAAAGEAGVAWDWIEITRGVVAMADPLAVATNLRLVAAGGRALSADEAACWLNGLVRELPWQCEVQRALQR